MKQSQTSTVNKIMFTITDMSKFRFQFKVKHNLKKYICAVKLADFFMWLVGHNTNNTSAACQTIRNNSNKCSINTKLLEFVIIWTF